jgi:hypothetical protein
MSTPHAPFGETFDAIDAEQAPSRTAIERAMAHISHEEPGFYLLDDCCGRFEVDRSFGVVSLRDESILEHERGSVHEARLRVVEPSGASYDIALKLRLTGRVPKMAGAEDIDFMAGAPALDAPAKPAPRPIAWAAYTATKDAPAAPIDEAARFGAALAAPEPPAAPGPYRLHLFTPLPPHADKTASWSL